jgi:erythronate-4-phosphate dehydrogenase
MPPVRRILCATSVADGHTAFSRLGVVTSLPEAAIDATALAGADVLIARSKVKITEALLEGSSLSFYGTATAGTDHVDAAALERRGIAWAEAAGSNANSVAEYVIATLCLIGLHREIDWRGRTLALIGAGHVGRRLATLAEALGLQVILNDPPLRDTTGDERYRPLEEALDAADIVSLHVPLTDHGPHPTRGLAEAVFFARMKPGTVFINASRGEVVDESALKNAIRKQHFSFVALDVFDHEPSIDIELLRMVDLATPHIAGYSIEGRRLGTELIYQAACRHFGLDPTWRAPTGGPPEFLPGTLDDADIRTLYDRILDAYNPALDDQRLRAMPVGVPMARHFQELRQHYPDRHPFSRYTIAGTGTAPTLGTRLQQLGFHVQP